MEFSKCLKIFEDYVNQYDRKIKEIDYKYNHTLRVVEYSKIICENEKFNELETKLTIIASLLHDIGRFEQWIKYNSWHSIDHGDLGYEILTKDNFVLKFVEQEYAKIILNAVKFHNKYEIPNNVSELEEKVLKVVRDADKIYILLTQNNMDNKDGYRDDYIKMENIIIDEEYINNILNEKMVSLKNNDIISGIIRQLSFLFDINYRTTFKIIYNYDIIDKKLSLLKKALKEEKQYKIIEIKIKDYLESNIKL